MITSLLFKKPIVVAACAYTIVGDTFAAVIGQNIKSLKIFHKTLLGSLGFFGSSIVVAVLLYYSPEGLPFSRLLIGALAATITEAMPLPWNDNFSTPIITGVVMSLI
jgi:dolichol kinase